MGFVQRLYNREMADTSPSTSRAEQRRRTEGRILLAARENFSKHGYDRATIRVVASAAKVNPGLVMHYFGSKENLFIQATKTLPDEPIGGTPAQVAEGLLAELHAKLSEEPTATLAMLRSMLTHPEATEGVREMLIRQQRTLSDALPADDAVPRAGLTSAIILGVMVSRYLLKLEGIRDASPEEITALLRPCFQSLTKSETETTHTERDGSQ